MLGGFFLSIISASIFFNNYEIFGFVKTYEITFNQFIIVILISLVSQIGDVAVSFFKRLSKIKNTGKIIPGHGGLLDRVDGMIFAFPFVYLLIDFF